MTISSSRYARSAGRYTLLALFVVLATCFQFAHAGLDEGSFDFCQPASPDTLAWAWSPDSTSDGDGVEYVAHLAAFEHAGPGSTSVTTTVQYRPGAPNHKDVADFVAWIVATNNHVTSASQLTVVKRVVTTIIIP